MNSQSLSEYQWENRVIVIFTETQKSENLESQLEIFRGETEGLKDRKLKVVQAIPSKMRTVLPEISNWEQSDLYPELKKNESDFEIILIGLDGGVKLRQQEILQTEKLFSLIDGMPMRKAEMRREDQ